MTALNQEILKDVLENILVKNSRDFDEFQPKECSLIKFFCSGKECLQTMIDRFSEVRDVNITAKYLYIPAIDYFVSPKSPLFALISIKVATSLKNLLLRSADPRCLPLLHSIKAPLVKLSLNREVLENDVCLAALSRISADKVVIDAEKMGCELLKILPIKTRELEITDLVLDKTEKEWTDNPALHVVEKLCIREYQVKHDQGFHLPALVAYYRKRFPHVKTYDIIQYTVADRDSGILRHFEGKNIKALRKDNPHVGIRIYIDVEFVKDDPMPDQYRNFLKSKMDRVDGYNGAKKFIQVSKKISVEMFVNFQDPIEVVEHHHHHGIEALQHLLPPHGNGEHQNPQNEDGAPQDDE